MGGLGAAVRDLCAAAVRAAAAPLCAPLRSRLFVLALANPSLTREDRDPLTSVAARGRQEPEPGFRRPQQADRSRAAALAERLGRIPGLEVRFAEAGQSDGETDGTRLFSALCAALADVPHDRIAGAIMITDGRVHDVPADAAALGFAAPVHALITGRKNERDRRVVLITTPRFGIVGQSQTVVLPVEDQGARRRHGTDHRAPRRRDDRSATSRPAAPCNVKCRSRTPDKHRRDRGRAARRRAHRRSTTARWSRSTACATSCACCWFPASRMPASAPGATC